MDKTVVKDLQQNIWFKMMREYLVDPNMSYLKLSKKYNIPLRTIEMRGANGHWPRMRADVMMQATKKVTEQAVNDLIKYRKKQIELGRLASSKALKRLIDDDVEPISERDVLAYLVEGLKLEGLGLGFNFKHPNIQNNFINMQQTNYNVER